LTNCSIQFFWSANGEASRIYLNAFSYRSTCFREFWRVSGWPPPKLKLDIAKPLELEPRKFFPEPEFPMGDFKESLFCSFTGDLSKLKFTLVFLLMEVLSLAFSLF